MDVTAFYKISYGVYIVSSFDGDELNGQISNTVFQVTSEPPQIEISINKLNHTHKLIEKSGLFGVSVLNTEVPMVYIGRFGFKSGREIEKFNDIEYTVSDNGIPIPLDYTVAHMECKVKQQLDVGSHTLFIGEIIDSKTYTQDDPLTYAYYHQIKKGKEPETAPTYMKKTK